MRISNGFIKSNNLILIDACKIKYVSVRQLLVLLFKILREIAMGKYSNLKTKVVEESMYLRSYI